MNRDQAFTDLTMIFREVFDNDSIQISDQMTAKDIKQWDSLNHINLIVSAEKKVRDTLHDGGSHSLANVGEFVDAIVKKTSSKSVSA